MAILGDLGIFCLFLGEVWCNPGKSWKTLWSYCVADKYIDAISSRNWQLYGFTFLPLQRIWLLAACCLLLAKLHILHRNGHRRNIWHHQQESKLFCKKEKEGLREKKKDIQAFLACFVQILASMNSLQCKFWSQHRNHTTKPAAFWGLYAYVFH